MAKGIIYVRVSSDEQVKGMSLDFQKADCSVYAKQKGMEIAHIFEERGESAKFADRPELLRLLDYCRKNKRTLSALIVWKLDRLSRNQLDYYYLKRRLLDYGISIHSATEPSMMDSSSIAGKVFETFAALQAEIDNTIRSERTKRGLLARYEAGIYPAMPPPGYRRAASRAKGDKKNAPDEPEPVLFPIVQRALREYGRGIHKQSDLVRLLNEQGWGLQRVRAYNQIVSRMLYKHLDFYAGWLRHPTSGERIRAAHVPMLTDEEFWRITSVRDGRSIGAGMSKNKLNPLFPLRGTAICAECLTPFTASVSSGRGGKFGYYRCYSRKCTAYGKSIRKEKIESEFAEIASQFRIHESFVSGLSEKLKAALVGINQDVRRMAELCEKKLTELEQKKARIYEMREDGSYGKEEFFERKAILEKEIDAVQTERAQRGERQDRIDEMLSYLYEFARQSGCRWEVMPFDVQRRFQQFAFPHGIVYSRDRGFGTPISGPISKLFFDFRNEQSHSVSLAGASWNPVLEDLERLAKLMESVTPLGLC